MVARGKLVDPHYAGAETATSANSSQHQIHPHNFDDMQKERVLLGHTRRTREIGVPGGGCRERSLVRFGRLHMSHRRSQGR